MLCNGYARRCCRDCRIGPARGVRRVFAFDTFLTGAGVRDLPPISDVPKDVLQLIESLAVRPVNTFRTIAEFARCRLQRPAPRRSPRHPEGLRTSLIASYDQKLKYDRLERTGAPSLSLSLWFKLGNAGCQRHFQRVIAARGTIGVRLPDRCSRSLCNQRNEKSQRRTIRARFRPNVLHVNARYKQEINNA